MGKETPKLDTWSDLPELLNVGEDLAYVLYGLVQKLVFYVTMYLMNQFVLSTNLI